MGRQTVQFLILWTWLKWMMFRVMITLRQGGLIPTYKMTLGITKISSLHFPVFTSVQLIGVMKNIIFGQQTPAVHQNKQIGSKRKLCRKASKCWFKLEWEWKTEVVHVFMCLTGPLFIAFLKLVKTLKQCPSWVTVHESSLFLFLVDTIQLVCIFPHQWDCEG